MITLSFKVCGMKFSYRTFNILIDYSGLSVNTFVIQFSFWYSEGTVMEPKSVVKCVVLTMLFFSGLFVLAYITEVDSATHRLLYTPFSYV